MLFDAALAVNMVAPIERCGPMRKAAADCAANVSGNAAFHRLLVEAVFECHRVDFDAGQSVGEAW